MSRTQAREVYGYGAGVRTRSNRAAVWARWVIVAAVAGTLAGVLAKGIGGQVTIVLIAAIGLLAVAFVALGIQMIYRGYRIWEGDDK